MTVERRLVCTGTLVEHVLGAAECTDPGCTTEVEQHWLVVRCEEIACRCGDTIGEVATSAR